MKKFISSRRRLVLLVCLILLAIAAVVGGTVAIYTSQAFQRSVVRNRDAEAIRFSSDILYRVASGTPAQTYYYPMGKGQNTMTFQVCNFDQTKNTVFSEKDIGYTITFQIRNGTDGFVYTINGNTVRNGGTVSITDSLKGAKRSTNSYSITFAESDYNKVEVAVLVTPTDLTLTKNTVLNGVLIPIEYATTQGVTLKYEFTDSARTINGEAAGPDQFDAYNLSVSISGGKGDVVISWDPEQLDIDPFFKEKARATEGTGENGYVTLTVPMNAENETGAYLIQFYNHNTTKPSWTKWSELPIRVALQESPSAG